MLHKPNVPPCLQDILTSIKCFECTFIVILKFSKKLSVPHFTLLMYFKKVLIKKHYHKKDFKAQCNFNTILMAPFLSDLILPIKPQIYALYFLFYLNKCK